MNELISNLSSPEELHRIVNEEKAVLLYISSPDCTICKNLKPRVFELTREEFPELIMYSIDAVQNPVIAGQLSVFSFPTVIVYFEKKEFLRKGRSFGLGELRNEIYRPYSLLFN